MEVDKNIRYKLCFYIPEPNADALKNALFAAGAGKIGHYDCCTWQTLGDGQFRPLKESEPYLGEANQLETVREYKIEMVCSAEVLPKVIETLHRCHPYEEPAYDVWPLLDVSKFKNAQ